MLVDYVTRGVKSGLVAGVVLGLFLAIVVNPLVAFADGLGHGEAGVESDHHATDHHRESADTVSPAVTRVVGVLSGVLWGVLLGGVVFGVAYYFLEPSIPGTGPTKSYLLAAAGFLTVSGAPWLVLPPRAPGVESSLTTDTRLLLYGGMMVAGAVVCLLCGVTYGRIRDRAGRTLALAAAPVPLCLLAIPAELSPTAATTGSLPPSLAAGIVGVVVFGQALLWGTLAGVHASLHASSRERVGSAATTPEVDPHASD